MCSLDQILNKCKKMNIMCMAIRNINGWIKAMNCVKRFCLWYVKVYTISKYRFSWDFLRVIESWFAVMTSYVLPLYHSCSECNLSDS